MTNKPIKAKRPRLSERAELTANVSDLLARRAYELMSGGGLHSFEDLLDDLGRLVPPGIAIRRHARDLAAGRRLRGIEASGPSTREPDPEARVASGRRAIVREFLHSGRAFEKVDSGKWRMVAMPQAVHSDNLRAEVLRPVLDALWSTYMAWGDDRAAWQLRLTGHEYGLHLSSCPKGCEMLPRERAD